MSTASVSTASDRALVCIDGVHKWFGSTQVLCSVSLDVHAGEAVCLLGRSGSGKSTLLRCINHLETIDRGSITVADERVGYRPRGDRWVEDSDRRIAARRSQIGMVFQQFNLFGHLTALENITLAPRIVSRRERRDAEDSARELLARVGLADKARAYPGQLSGGQQQRIAIARALAMRPKLMLFDEPTSALDPEMVGEVLDVIADLVAQGTTMMIVTHEMSFARSVASRIVMLDDGQIVEQASPEDFFTRPRDHRTQSFLARYAH
jgi:polar amino acid transport system ATP-binding protein